MKDPEIPSPPILYLYRSDTGEKWPITADYLLLGSDPGRPGLPPMPGLAGEHLELGVTEDGTWFRDAARRQDLFHNQAPATEGWLNPGDLLQVGELAFWIVEEERVKPSPSRLKAGWIFKTFAALLLILLIGIPIFLAAPSGEWSLLPQMISTLLTNGPSGRLNPAPIPSSGSKKIDLKPFDGLRVRAPRNALDKPRELKIRKLDQRELKESARRAGLTGAVPLAALEIDSGMEPFDRYPGEVTLEFDLEKLKIPPPLWPTTRLLQLEEDGTTFLLSSNIQGKQLTGKISRNSVIIIAGAVIIPAGLAYWYYKDMKNVPGGPFISFVVPGSDQFIIHLGTKSLPIRRPKVVIETILKMNLIRAKYGLNSIRFDSDTPPYFHVVGAEYTTVDLEAETSLRSDSDYLALERLWRDPLWVRDNITPLQVHLTSEALRHAKRYLKKRKFRWPTYDIEVFLPNKGMSGFGYTANTWFKRPFLILNKSKIPDAEPGSSGWSGEMQGCWDNMNLTIVHELFHVVQTRYFWIPEITSNDLWFFEATAVTLEGEAKEYYMSQPELNVLSWHGTVRDYSAFREELDLTSGNINSRQEHGYCASYFLEYLRDRYYKGEKDKFLPRLMEDYSSFRGSRLKSLYRVTSNSAKQFGKDYLEFSKKHADDLFIDTKYLKKMITEKKPYYFWEHKTFKELRSPVLEIALKAPDRSPSDLDEVVVVAMEEESSLLEFASPYTVQQWDPLSGKFRRPKKRTHVKIPKKWGTRLKGSIKTSETTIKGCQEFMSTSVTSGADLESHCRKWGIPFRFQRIEHTLFSIFSSWNRSSKKGIHIFAMFKPEAKPVFTPDWEEKKLTIRIPPSILAKKKLIEGYLITLEKWESVQQWEERQTVNKLTPQKPVLKVFLKLDKNEIDLRPILEEIVGDGSINPSNLFGVILPDELSEMIDVWRTYMTTPGEIRITYREVASRKDKIIGPESEIFTLPVEEEALSFGLGGIWDGRIWLVRRLATLKISSSSGGMIRGTWNFSGNGGTFKGTWEPAEKGWKLDFIMVDPTEGEIPVFYTSYLRRLPDNRLWLSFPSTVLKNKRYSKKEKKRGFLEEWMPWLSKGKEKKAS